MVNSYWLERYAFHHVCAREEESEEGAGKTTEWRQTPCAMADP